MLPQLNVFPWCLIGRSWAALFLIATVVLAALAPAAVQGKSRQNNETVALGSETRFVFFDLAPAGSYDIEKNGAAFDSKTVSPHGTLSFEDNAALEDRYSLVLGGVEPVDPSAPSNFAVAGSDVGCGQFSWANPPPSEYVSDYMLLWGTASGGYTDSTAVQSYAVSHAVETVVYTRCGYSDNTYYFALRAHNQFDRWSPLSAEASATITNGNKQGPPAPMNVSVSETDWGCATVVWDAVGDPTVAGYMVYWSRESVASGGASQYHDSVVVGNQTTSEICRFSEGDAYFAVKSYTGTGIKSPFSEEVSVALAGVDVAGPTYAGFLPADGATSVSRNAVIYLGIKDDKTGVDPSSIKVELNGRAQKQVTSIGSPLSVMVVCDPDTDLPPNTDVTVLVTAADGADPPNETSTSWRFTTGDSAAVDTSPPVISGLSPEDGAVDVPPDSPVELTISDDVLGIDMSSIVLYVDDMEVRYSIEGSLFEAVVRFENEDGFQPGSRVEVRLEVCDKADPPNCSSLTDFSFTVRSDSPDYAQGLPLGAIVPDGFWANDPTRPLEIHNLPPRWSVRIYDAAGALVRKHRNPLEKAPVWTWDFKNDHGSQVARAMYLVRVIDGAGNVRQSGRFVVQMDP